MDQAALPAIRHWYVHRGEAGRPARPQTWPELFARLFAGDLFVLGGTAASQGLASRVRQVLADVAGVAGPGSDGASAAWRCPALDARVVARVREALYAQPDLHAHAASVVAALGMR